MRYLTTISIFTLVFSSVVATTIEEKKQQLSKSGLEEYDDNALARLNQELHQLRDALSDKYSKVAKLQGEKAEESQFEELLSEVNRIRTEIRDLETKWRDVAKDEINKDDEGYAFWDQEETTLSQMIMEYGANDFLYIIPPEMLSMKLNMHSSMPIPRESWGELLELILSQNGIGIKQLNAYAKQLYILKQDLIAVSSILNRREDLQKVPQGQRVIFVFTPPPERAKSVSYFFERFRDAKKTHIHQIGFKVAIVASKEEVEKLISLYDAVWEKESIKVTKVVSLARIKPVEMEKVLKAYFGEVNDRSRMGMLKGNEDLGVLTLNHENAIVLIGMKDVVRKAEKIIKETEEQISDPCEMTIFWYTCRHSDPIDLSNVLQKVYQSLICTNAQDENGASKEKGKNDPKIDPEFSINVNSSCASPMTPNVVNPPVAIAGTADSQKRKSHSLNFIPDPKTGSIMLVVRKDTLDQIKDLIRKLDVPKRMVQIEVLLFEKRVKNKNNFGLNVLKLGNAAKGVHETGLSFDTSSEAVNKGILKFFLSRPKTSSFPAIDIAYNFLMAQEDVRINASPSITTVNQTPAQVSIVEEISINNGAAPIQTNDGIVFENSYTRQQYGVTIAMTPTVHDADPFADEDYRFITLDTDVTFDTINSDTNDRPKVNRRHLKNQVRVIDGETVILGGLRRKTGEDNTEKIPFLGEIPGIAKFFGSSRLTDDLTEMIIFITPKILEDDKADMAKVRDAELRKRPGDLPEFLEKINEAKRNQKQKVFENSFKLLFGSNESAFNS